MFTKISIDAGKVSEKALYILWMMYRQHFTLQLSTILKGRKEVTNNTFCTFFFLYSNRPFSHIPHLTTTASSTIKCTKCCLLGTIHLLMSNQTLFEQNYDFAYFMSFEQQIISDSLSTRHFEYVNGVNLKSNPILEEKTGFCSGILTGTFRSKIKILL